MGGSEESATKESKEQSQQKNDETTGATLKVNLKLDNKRGQKRKRKATNVLLETDSSSDEEEEKTNPTETEKQQQKGEEERPESTPAKPDTTPADSVKASPPTEAVQQPKGWRVKLYRLNSDGTWDDCGTGRIVCNYREASPPSPQTQQQQANSNVDQWIASETGEATLVVHGEISKQNPGPRILLRTRILLREAYQRQGDNIITWCEPHFSVASRDNANVTESPNAETEGDGAGSGVDLALSFQDNAGCLEIWNQITNVQNKAAALSSLEVAAQVSAQHHADLQQEVDGQHVAATALMDFNASLPNPPKLADLDGIADAIATLQHVQQRESLANWIAQNECLYLRRILECFPEAETQNDYGKLATLAACVKTILLLNDPSILDLIVNDAQMFESICSCLEYDPDLREKANHRWFLRERAKFRTVVRLQNPGLVASIHRSFRVQYLRDTLLRPTMDESSLSTLTSLQTFIHADVVKGVTMSERDSVSLKDSYLVRVIRVLGIELHAIGIVEWTIDMEQLTHGSSASTTWKEDVGSSLTELPGEELVLDGSIVVTGETAATKHTPWKQYLSPQDSSVTSRRTRRHGCLSFLKELFGMVRLSLQPSDKDDFFAVVCSLEIDLLEDREIPDNTSQTSQQAEVGSVASTNASTIKSDIEKETQFADFNTLNSPSNLLSLLANVLSDPNADTSEKALALEIVSGVAMHDSRLIRRHCLEYHTVWNNHEKARPNVTISRPEPNDRKQVLFMCPSNDLLGALLFLLDVETDVGVLLQVTEIMRVVLDIDLVGDQGPVNAFAEEGGVPNNNGQQVPNQQQAITPVQSMQAANSSDQKQFLSLFFENYVEWLVAPFQCTIVHAIRKIPDDVLRNQNESTLLQRVLKSFHNGVSNDNQLLKIVRPCAVRSSFAVELLSFCVRAHLHRMKFFLLRTSVLGNVLQALRPRNRVVSGDRCLKLAALRFFRAVLSVNDEFYNRHIIQHNHFEPVFEAFRSNPVGDNLVSSAIVEICDFVHNENIKSLLEHIVTKHMSFEPMGDNSPSIEDVSSPYVNTLTVLRKSYEDNQRAASERTDGKNSEVTGYFPGGSQPQSHGRVLTGKALEEQRKFRELDQSESYFDSDDTNSAAHGASSTPRTSVPPAVDEVEQVESELHRTPRMFSLAQAPLLTNLEESKDTRQTASEEDPADGDNDGSR